MIRRLQLLLASLPGAARRCMRILELMLLKLLLAMLLLLLEAVCIAQLQFVVLKRFSFLFRHGI
jgi:hypothetical protein